MTLWLYTLTKNNDAGFINLKNNHKVQATADNFIKTVKNKTLLENDWWGVRNLYKDIDVNDEVYINGVGEGLIGYATVIKKFDQDKEIYLQFDIEECEKYIRTRVGFDLIEPYLIKKNVRLSSVIRIEEAFKTVINSYFPNNPIPIEIDIADCPLVLDKAVKSSVDRKDFNITLVHNNVLMPLVIDFLKNEGFKQFKNILSVFQGFIPDFVGVKNDYIIVVEAKTNIWNNGKDEARTALGQLLHYIFCLEKNTSLSKYKKDFCRWIPFQNKPDDRIIEFLEYYQVLISWIDDNKIIFTKKSKKLFESYYR